MWQMMGSSVRGPAHRRAGQPNQDAWLSRQNRAFALAVIADGLGSRPHAAAGSRAACRAVAEAARAWSAAPGAPPDLLLRLDPDELDARDRAVLAGVGWLVTEHAVVGPEVVGRGDAVAD